MRGDGFELGIDQLLAESLSGRALVYAKLLTKRSRSGLAAMKALSRRAMEGDLQTGLQQENALATRPPKEADSKEGAPREERSPRFG